MEVWLVATPDGLCGLKPETITGDYIINGSGGFLYATSTAVVKEKGPITFNVDAKSKCCCAENKIECALYYLHAIAVTGLGIEISVADGKATVTSTLEISRHDHWFQLVVCSDDSTSAEVISKRKTGLPGTFLTLTANSKSKNTRFLPDDLGILTLKDVNEGGCITNLENGEITTSIEKSVRNAN